MFRVSRLNFSVPYIGTFSVDLLANYNAMRLFYINKFVVDKTTIPLSSLLTVLCLIVFKNTSNETINFSSLRMSKHGACTFCELN